MMQVETVGFWNVAEFVLSVLIALVILFGIVALIVFTIRETINKFRKKRVQPKEEERR
jgi:large-conductance mechanosensitive channel